ncbi:glycosyltransferase family 2 protein [Nocardioides daejeonensis]|uniref:glycosyltransferase family 2 protein n=1 Tax=Nocardioides daejeonensis TaxID=1046556 RepID=UPI001EF6266B|nr:glycosyltransferase family 2 protein [Nocardioides daejeonensis]
MSIVAVVVTFNRLDLLRELVATLRVNPLLASILIVDNASTDGTGEWLRDEAQRADGVPLVPVMLPENRGGAGGFHEGVRRAMELDADLVWLMDDDGLPDPECLATLLEHRGLDFWGPLVVDREAPQELVFPIRLPGGARTVHSVDDARSAARAGRIDDIVIPFNGVLVTRELVTRIGLPRSEFFIWGDDHDYRLRAEEAGAQIATVVDAVVRHPSVGELGTPMMFGRTTYNHSPSDLKHYCMSRNNVVNLRNHRGWLFVLAFIVKTAWFYTVTRPSAKRLRLSASGIRAGLRNDFTGHGRFLR